MADQLHLAGVRRWRSVSMAYVLRLTRNKLLETAGADFMRTAKAKGLPSRTIMRKYGLRNSLIPVVTFLGADLGALMGGAVVTEGIFNIPGSAISSSRRSGSRKPRSWSASRPSWSSSSCSRA